MDLSSEPSIPRVQDRGEGNSLCATRFISPLLLSQVITIATSLKSLFISSIGSQGAKSPKCRGAKGGKKNIIIRLSHKLSILK